MTVSPERRATKPVFSLPRASALWVRSATGRTDYGAQPGLSSSIPAPRWVRSRRLYPVLAAAIAFASPVAAEPSVTLSGTVITLAPTEHQGAVAEITMHNRATNGPQDNQSFTLEWGGLSVGVEFTWNADGGQNDRITVEPPEGFIAVPRTLDVMEFTVGRLFIFPLDGVGL